MKPTLLITGASGFIGSHFIRMYGGKYRCIALVKAEAPTCKRASHRKQALEQIAHHCTIASFSSYDEIEQIIARYEIAGILHLAAQSGHIDKASIPACIEANITLGAQILEALQKYPACFFLNALSYFQFAPLDATTASTSLDPTTASSAYNPINFYAASTQTPLYMSSGRQILDISHIDDVIAGISMLIDSLLTHTQRVNNCIYSFESSNRVSLRALADIFEQESNKPLPLIWGARSDDAVIQTPLSLEHHKAIQSPSMHASMPFASPLKPTAHLSCNAFFTTSTTHVPCQPSYANTSFASCAFNTSAQASYPLSSSLLTHSYKIKQASTQALAHHFAKKPLESKHTDIAHTSTDITHTKKPLDATHLNNHTDATHLKSPPPPPSISSASATMSL